MNKNKKCGNGDAITNTYFRETSPYAGMEFWGDAHFPSLQEAERAVRKFREDNPGENFHVSTTKSFISHP